MPTDEKPEPLGERSNESLNGKIRDELANGELFFTLKETQILIERHVRLVRGRTVDSRQPASLASRRLSHGRA